MITVAAVWNEVVIIIQPRKETISNNKNVQPIERPNRQIELAKSELAKRRLSLSLVR